ncbi:MAG: bifunctional phosphopantothenoylcysteine decarboxylase/phosphopantothenate--cysteine ligase CoaBC [Bacteroidetes bacterium HGW-Bacteroidetes-1]|jgi:phosphopantothenoylcysteine decarboxylase/phosphopantothenate--cysteine ligase|nr:MAG: bifunctional phosphopantothenoylcysteine decarboxylase/phosphopantothenate--cysteine ligase CoaBC [Bacteroidetes bacterium HGW-Bacteroidetes-1]
MLKGKKILIGITGGIAAYKIPLLIRLLIKNGAEVQVILSPSAKDFVTPLTLATLSNNPVHSGFFDNETGKWHSHVELGLWADLFVVAPATANSIAKMNLGIADNYLLTVYLSARCPVMIAPAMDLDMFKHSATQKNLTALRARKHIIVEPTSGELASGLCGEGRMEEPDEIFKLITSFFSKKKQFKGKKILISAGPTFEAIDPVRFIGNYSTGRMGIEIAKSFANQGGEVFLVLGPTDLTVDHPMIEVFPVTTADEMFDQCQMQFPSCDIAVMTAAVADFKPKVKANQKIKKTDNDLFLELTPTPDILKSLGQKKRDNQLLVGFALETNNEVENALIKLRSKNLDLIILNSLSDPGAGFRHSTNKVTIIDRHENLKTFPLKSKTEVADDITSAIATL